ncbi:hypothetical protein PSHT_10370 [Puccinia striiformis]|uniref:Uncharacterized protein n=1 Tax=Puccinia striiformis TaxID=27350 RepID=A0A2S4VA74_9BASI|nr:hypothetical protein PSHT_10370 [Puccinia striiformis]
MTIGGIGSIAKAIGSIEKRNQIEQMHTDMFLPHQEDAASSVRMRYLISANKLDIPLNTKFTSHLRILLRENLDSLGANTGIMIVNVSD